MVFRCKTVMQVVCTVWCLVSLVMLGVATIVTHRALARLIPPVIDMPQNLREGLDHVLNFDQLEQSAATVKNFSQQALSKCQITEPELGCSSELPLNPDTYNATEDVESLLGLDTHNVSAEVDGISAAFADVLDEIERVTTDKYLGIEDFNSTAKRLQEIKAELSKLRDENNGSAPCVAMTQSFCPIFKNAHELVGGMSQVQEAIALITDNDGVQALEKHEQRLRGLHILPYLGWVGMVFYACFFFSPKAVTMCRGGSCGACVAFSCYSLCFVAYFAICLVVTGVALAGSIMARDLKLQEPFTNEPTLAKLVDHIEVKFPELYSVVLKDFVRGLEAVRGAFLLNTFVCFFIFLHTVSACCCGVYKDASQSAEK